MPIKYSSVIILLVFVFVNTINCDISLLEKNVTQNQNIKADDVIKAPIRHKINIYDYLYPGNLTLDEKIHLENTVWHWYPWKKLTYVINAEGKAESECADINHSVHDFPNFVWNVDELPVYGLILHFIGALYFFAVTALIINDYFVPTVQVICDSLNLKEDVAAATFMATATTMPEFFTNTVSTFIAESDMGIGAVLGSSMFNMLGVATIITLSSKTPIQMDWFQPSRDCLLYGINVSLLVFFVWDGQIVWWEASILISLIMFYYTIMFQNENIKRFIKSSIEKGCFRKKVVRENIFEGKYNKYKTDNEDKYEIQIAEAISEAVKPLEIADLPLKERKSLWKIPENRSKLKLFIWFITWPIKLILTCLIPNVKTYRKLYPLSFIMCIVAIGTNSYMTVWMVTVIGYYFGFSEGIMGLTLLAAGGCLPETFSGVVMARKGLGHTGISNAIGSNSLAILISLGLPWFIRAAIFRGDDVNSFINIGSYGIAFSVLTLLVITTCLYITFAIFKFKLRKRVGFILGCLYVLFLSFTLLIELEIIFKDGTSC